jgi:hypothetical protein
VPTFAFYVSGVEAGPNPNDFTNLYYAMAGAVQIDVLGDVVAASGLTYGGELDYNDGAGNTSPGEPGTADTIAPATGALVVDTNGQGTLTLTTSNVNLGPAATPGIITLGVQFVNSNHALITQFDGSATSSGSLDLQTATAIPSSSNFAFTLSGVDTGYEPYVLGGVFTTDSASATISGIVDVDDDGTVVANPGTTFTDYTVSTPDTFGRGYVTTNTGSIPTLIAYYVVGPEVLRLVDVDAETAPTGPWGAASSGSAFGQGSTTFTSTSIGSSVFGVLDDPIDGEYAGLGSFTVPSAGTISGIGDDDEVGTPAIGVPIAGTYTVSTTAGENGYSNIQLTTPLADITNLGVYLTDPTLNIMDPNNSIALSGATVGGGLVADMSGVFFGSGVLYPQTDTTVADFTGSTSGYAFGGQDYNDLDLTEAQTSFEFDFVGQGTFDTSGDFSGYGELNDVFNAFGTATQDTAVTFAGTPVPDVATTNPDGRYTLPLVVTIPTTTPIVQDLNVVIYQASGTQAFWLDEDADSVFLGPIEQQGTLLPPSASAGKGVAKSARPKHKH